MHPAATNTTCKPTPLRAARPPPPARSGAPAVMLAFVKHMWATGSRQEALSRLQVRPSAARAPASRPLAPCCTPRACVWHAALNLAGQAAIRFLCAS